jgi:ABC-type multidrug transport system fused ATPase/permease subunit
VHRLSTVKNADQIVVMEKGELLKSVRMKNLLLVGDNIFFVKNQFELGN